MIYFQNEPKVDGTLYEFLLSIKNSIYFCPTFLNKECTIKECHTARRSFNDLLKICKCYIPETTEADLAKLVTDDTKFFTRLCGNIDKWVFGFHIGGWPEYLREGTEDEIDIDGWTLKKIKKLAK